MLDLIGDEETGARFDEVVGWNENFSCGIRSGWDYPDKPTDLADDGDLDYLEGHRIGREAWQACVDAGLAS